jgi:hypothetical protein
LALPGLALVLPPWFLRRCSGAPKFSLVKRKAKSNAGGLHLLLIIKCPGATPAILLLQLPLN